MRPEGLAPYGWGNGPCDTYDWHEYSYTKVLYCNSSPTGSAWSYSVTLPVPSACAWSGLVPAVNMYGPQMCVLRRLRHGPGPDCGNVRSPRTQRLAWVPGPRHTVDNDVLYAVDGTEPGCGPGGNPRFLRKPRNEALALTG